MSATDYTEIVETVSGKVAKKLKEITKELDISRVLSRVSKKCPAVPSSQLSLEAAAISREVTDVALLPSGTKSEQRIPRSFHHLRLRERKFYLSLK